MLVMYLAVFFQFVFLCIVNNLIQKTTFSRVHFFRTVATIAVVGSFLSVTIELYSVFFVLMLLIFANYIHCQKLVQSVATAVVAHLIMIVSDHSTSVLLFQLIGVSLGDIAASSPLVINQVIGSGVIAISFAVLIRWLIKKFPRDIQLSSRSWILGLVIAVVTLLFYYVNIFYGQARGSDPELITMNTIYFVIYFFIMCVVFVMLLISTVKEVRVKSKQDEFERLQLYSETLEEMHAEMRKFKHDYINILSSMSEYIQERNMDGLETYFNEKIAKTTGIMSNNSMIDLLKNVKVIELKGIVSSKMIKAQEKGIEIRLEVAEPVTKVNMDPIALCRCIGILLDNAIEETEHIKSGCIQVAFIQRTSSLLLVVVNSCRNDIALQHVMKPGFSTKGEGRGMGLSNLREITGRYEHVMLNTQVRGNEFIQEIEIFN